jgi:hypothetical protein
MGECSPAVPTARFAARIWLTKREVFAACQALADAGRVLARSGRLAEADALGDLFELFEDRLSGGTQPGGSGDSDAGSYSSEREFTQ